MPTLRISRANLILISMLLPAAFAPRTGLAAAAPSITSQPQSQSALEGSTASFSVSASGQAPLSYQWSCDGTNLVNSAHINGATDPTLVVNNITAADAGDYQVVVSNNRGAATSAKATLTVLFPPRITTQPTNQVAGPGGAAIFTVTGAGSEPLVYQWQQDGTNLVNDGRISGATSPALRIANIQMRDAGAYRLILSNAYGVATSAEASLLAVPILVRGFDYLTNAPSSLTNATALAAGVYHNLGLKSDGSVVAWGNNTYDQTNLPPGLSNVVALAAGQSQSLALRSDGTVVAWGDNTFGQASLPWNLSNVVAVAAGDYHNLALRNNGSLVAWGLNNYGQTRVPDGLSNVIAVAAGSGHSLALRNTGTVVAWGRNHLGQTNVPFGLSNVVAVSACGANSLALKSDGTVVAWGDNSSSQTNVPPGLSQVTAIAAGYAHSLALKADGAVVGWGDNSYGQSVLASNPDPVVALAAGFYGSLALVENPATQLPPIIWSQPPSSVLPAGQALVFNPAVAGSLPQHFQWYFNGQALTGQTNKWLVLNSIRPEQAGSYHFMVTNKYGSASSQAAVVSVSPAIVAQPINQTVFQGANATFSASVTGCEPLSYQWQVKGTSIPCCWVVMNGATNSTLTITNAQGAQSGDNYRLAATNAFGSVLSDVATLTVLTRPVFTSQPQSRTNALGRSVSFSGTVTGTEPIDFQWFFNGTLLTNSDRVQTFYVHNSTYTWVTISNLQTSDEGSYSIVASNLIGKTTSSEAILTVVVPPSITQQPASQAAILGSNVVLSVTAAGSEPLAYQWRVDGTPLLDGGRIAGSQTAALSIFNAGLSDAADYSVVITNFAGAITSAAATLAVYGVEITVPPSSRLVRLGSNATFSVVAKGQEPLSYQWYCNGTALSDGGRISGSATPTLTVSRVQTSDGGSYSVVVTNPWSGATSPLATLRLQANTSSAVLYVDANSSNPRSPYLDWATAATNIQDAVDSAINGNQILVTNGLYSSGGAVVYGSATNRVALTKAIQLSSLNGPQGTIIAGAPQTRGVYVGSNAVLNGFTIMNGQASSRGDGIKEGSGGGVWCEASGIVTNCLIRSNSAPAVSTDNPRSGGGAYGGTLYNCTIEGNQGFLGGGASGSTLWNCTINGNRNNDSASSSGGGGAYLCALFNCVVSSNSTSPSSYGHGAGAYRCILSNCLVSGNTALYSSSGGGTYQGTNYNCLLTGNSAIFLAGGSDDSTNFNCILSGNKSSYGGGSANGQNYNCLIAGNSAFRYGGGVYQGTHYNCTIVNNSATNISPSAAGTGGGAYGSVLYNSIIYFNSADAAASSNWDHSTFTSCCTSPGGQVSSDPGFVNPAGGNYRLQNNSPCINRGHPFYVFTNTDLDGRPRKVGAMVDIGAYEFQGVGMGEFIGWLRQYGLAADGSADYADPDGDRMSNWQEWRAHTDPTNGSSVLALQPPAVTVTNATVTWQSVAGVGYFLQRSTALGAQAPFLTVESNIIGQAGTTTYTDTNAVGSRAVFYRVGVQ